MTKGKVGVQNMTVLHCSALCLDLAYLMQYRSLQNVVAGKKVNAAFSVDSESEVEGSEDYQEDFEDEEAQTPAPAVLKKNGSQSVRKV